MKWYLPDESDADEADSLLMAFSLGQIVLIAPHHIHYEVSNALRTAVHRHRLEESFARQAMLDFLELEIPTVVGTQLIVRGWSASMRFDCALYDGLYLALSEMMNAQFVHADGRLQNTLAQRFPLELWIDDFDANT
jgi:predicted nucleic acid-binding protein